MAAIFDQNLIPATDTARLEALKKYNILYTAPEEAFDNITQSMALVFGAPLAFVSLVGEHTVFYKSQAGNFGRDRVERQDSLCSYTILESDLLVVTDAHEVDALKENPYVTAEGGIRFYAGAPLITHDGHHIGTACVVDTTPRSFSEDQKVLMGLFARMVMHEIEQRQIAQRQAVLQEALDKAQMQLTTALKAGKVTTWHWDLASNLISGAADLAQLFDQDKNEIFSGINSESLLTVVHPDDQQTIVSSIENALDTGHDYEAEYRIVSSTGEERWVVARGQIHYEQDEPKSLTGVVIDITEKKTIEKENEARNEELRNLYQEFQFVTDTIPQLIWATHPNGSAYFYNKVWMEYTGAHLDDIKGYGWLNWLHPEDVEEATLNWNKAVETGTAYETEYRLRDAKGNYKWFLARGTPMKDQEGAIQKWYGTTTDIQEHKMAHQELESHVAARTRELLDANTHLLHLNAELEQFAYVSHHDLREPIRKILIFAQMIKSESASSLDPTSQGWLDKVIATAERMNVALSDILNYATLGRQEEFEEVDLNGVIAEIVRGQQPFLHQKKGTIDVGALPILRAIPHLMHQLFYNLISNALKFSKPDCPPLIRISSRLFTPQEVASNERLVPERTYYEIKVEDNGIGIEEAYTDRIFRLFQRLHARESYQGTGIGLALVKKVVSAHEGIIHVQSTPQQGSSFVVILPD